MTSSRHPLLLNLSPEQQRQLWREHPVSTMEILSHGKMTPEPHLIFIAEKIRRAIYAGSARLIIQAPVRHGKSVLTSHYTPVWYLDHFSGKRIILTSYEAAFAATWGRRVRNTIKEWAGVHRATVAEDSAAADAWDTTAGGGMITAGTGGAITGRGADLLLVDDPIKNFEEANSETYREKVWDWFRSTAYTRLEPGGSCIITMARWHEDDLVGRLLAEQRQNPRGERWDLVNLPAIAEDGDALERPVGAPLWPKRYDLSTLGTIKEAVGSYTWSSLYQQRPSPGGGGRFRREWFKYWQWADGEQGEPIVELFDANGAVRRFAKSKLWYFTTADLALSVREEADWTVILAWAVTPHSDLLLVEMWRDRREAPDVKAALWSMCRKYDECVGGIEKAHYGAAVIQELGREGYPFVELKPDKDKVTRALLASVRMEQGKVFFPRHMAHLDDVEDELLAFPKGKHDDIVDCVAYACIYQHGIKLDEPRAKWRDGTFGAIDGANQRIAKENGEDDDEDVKLTPGQRFLKARGLFR